MTKITLATSQDHFKTIAQLADIIWRKHYIPITGVGQVEHMLEKYQSASAISNQTKEGYEYYLITFEDVNVGYISIKKEVDTLFLSKIYVLGDYRGKKIGKTAMRFIEEKAKAYNLNSITLTVNKNNTNSIKAYEKMGFKNIEAIVMDIGKGFVMDDYKMLKNL